MIRRIPYILILISLFCADALAQGYFCDKEGAELVYNRRSVTDNTFSWKHVLVISKVESKNESSYITTTSTFYKSNGKPLYKSSVIESVVMDAQHNVSTDMGSAMTSYIKARVGVNATPSGSCSVLPSTMQPGDTLPEVNAQAKWGILAYNVRVYDRKVLRSETISVPAGTFDCMVIEEHKTETGPGHNRQVKNVTWYSQGIGYVRHDTYETNGTITSELLHSLTP